MAMASALAGAVYTDGDAGGTGCGILLGMWVVLGLLLAQTAQPAAVQAASPRVTCLGAGAAAGRAFVLERPAPGRPWRLSYRDREHPQWIRLTLEGATPVIEGDAVRLQYRNANGGRQVDLDVSPSGARLDVYVDYGLDVNIDPDLDPEVDRMNTEGPLTTIECRVTS